nr:hypothetical protein BaRGS_006533 [Batillaria attramentaria]KAG5700547.1 hypothetical protein BaRGS_025259 [Batillaria attramentaria]
MKPAEGSWEPTKLAEAEFRTGARDRKRNSLAAEARTAGGVCQIGEGGGHPEGTGPAAAGHQTTLPASQPIATKLASPADKRTQQRDFDLSTGIHIFTVYPLQGSLEGSPFNLCNLNSLSNPAKCRSNDNTA